VLLIFFVAVALISGTMVHFGLSVVTSLSSQHKLLI